MSNDTLFDWQPEPEPSGRAFERGMEGSQQSALAKWSDDEVVKVRNAIRAVAGRHHRFTTDEIWKELGDGFPFSKGIGVQMLVVSREGVLKSTGETVISRRGGDHGHAQRLTVWKSLLLEDVQ